MEPETEKPAVDADATPPVPEAAPRGRVIQFVRPDPTRRDRFAALHRKTDPAPPDEKEN
jgi:hypothetical protein